MRILVTGVTGFVGWHAARRMVEAGHEVRVLARDAVKAERCLSPLGIDSSHVVVGCMTDASAVDRAVDGCDAVVHAAASVSVTVAGGDSAFDDNVLGTERVIGTACEKGVEHVVFVSSAAAIFDPRAQAITADSPLVDSDTRYGRSKVASDRIVRNLQQDGAPVATVYPSGVIGPHDPGLSESVRAYRRFLRGTLRSSGGTQFVDVRDLAEVLLRLTENGQAGRYVAAGPFFTWSELTVLIEEVCGVRLSRINAPGWLLRGAGRVADTVARLTGATLPISGEALSVATLWRPIADSPAITGMGFPWHPPHQTLHDMYEWFVSSGRLAAEQVPGLVPQPDTPDGG